MTQFVLKMRKGTKRWRSTFSKKEGKGKEESEGVTTKTTMGFAFGDKEERRVEEGDYYNRGVIKWKIQRVLAAQLKRFGKDVKFVKF